MPFPPSAGKDLPLSEENSDLSILSVRDSSSGHEIEQTPVATGFQAHLFESKLDSLTNSMLKMSDSLALAVSINENQSSITNQYNQYNQLSVID